jgi:uncharacterized protein YbcC (UPF0753/DUF2309 family)
MPYQHCPTCHVTVPSPAAECPRCGGALVARVLAARLNTSAVREALVKRGGRFRPQPSRTGRFRPAGRPNRAA